MSVVSHNLHRRHLNASARGKKVESVIKDDPEALRLFREATTAENHRPAKDESSDNVTTYSDGRGNSLAYTLDRLHREAPELYEAVVAKEMSANAAALPRRHAAQLHENVDQIAAMLERAGCHGESFRRTGQHFAHGEHVRRTLGKPIDHLVCVADETERNEQWRIVGSGARWRRMQLGVRERVQRFAFVQLRRSISAAWHPGSLAAADGLSRYKMLGSAIR